MVKWYDHFSRCMSMNNMIKCYRCGTEYPVPKKDFEEVYCPHCKGKMQLNKKSRRSITICKTLFYVLCCALVLVISGFVHVDIGSQLNIMFILITAAIFFGAYYLSEKVTLYILQRSGKLTYVHERDKSDEKRERKAK